MGGTSINKGKQQVSIYPQQLLSSVYGNQLLWGVVNIGVSDVSLSLASDSGTGVRVNIGAGSKFVFKREADDPISGEHVTLMGKIILADDTYFDIPMASISNQHKLYIIADWSYDAADKYVSFSYLNSISGKTFTDADHILVLGTLLNTYGAVSYTDLNISYEGQINRDIAPRNTTKNDQFMVQFDGDGTGVYISQGTAFDGKSFLSSETTSLWGAGSSYCGQNYTASKLSPASGITSYVDNLVSGNVIDITGNESSYYQIDFLRLKKDYLTHTEAFVWESFLRPKGSFNLPATQSAIINYLTSVNDFTLDGLGFNIMVVVRLRSALSTSFWPKNCVIFNDNTLSNITGVETSSRLKLPVYSASDIGM